MRDALARIQEAAHRLKVFPLPSAVLLPGGVLPLHIFEPRYRAMVRDAVDGDGVFAMAQVLPGQEGALAGVPDLDPMLCVGVVSMHELMEDGRSNLVLTGVCRARVLREWPREKPYREVEAEALPDADYQGPEDAALRAALFELMARVPSELGQRIAQVTSGARGGALASGALDVGFDWSASGPFAAGPVEIAGKASGAGRVGGRRATPEVRMEAGFDAIDL
ncbi:MAG: LON peptidase substrate-binding domain-containing protein, partial [Myxococcaceae bacterium]|nr:LON peptidase substrate-binding domain-containing protein [Myxococcaceae bacterium]